LQTSLESFLNVNVVVMNVTGKNTLAHFEKEFNYFGHKSFIVHAPLVGVSIIIEGLG
jgi:hypothetical protein